MDESRKQMNRVKAFVPWTVLLLLFVHDCIKGTSGNVMMH